MVLNNQIYRLYTHSDSDLGVTARPIFSMAALKFMVMEVLMSRAHGRCTGRTSIAGGQEVRSDCAQRPLQ